MALAIWKRLPANRRDEVLKRMSRVGADRLESYSGAAGVGSPALEVLNRRMQIVLVSAKQAQPGISRPVSVAAEAYAAGAGGAAQTVHVDLNDATAPTALDFVGYGSAAQAKSYGAAGTYALVASDAGNAEVRGLRDVTCT
jgi:hypothetical protein